MAKLHENSAESISPHLMLFSLPPVDTTIERVQMPDYRPISQFTSSGPIEFHIPGSDKTYKALHESSLKLKVRILKKMDLL
jgi:hypothetical protein